MAALEAGTASDQPMPTREKQSMKGKRGNSCWQGSCNVCVSPVEAALDSEKSSDPKTSLPTSIFPTNHFISLPENFKSWPILKEQLFPGLRHKINQKSLDLQRLLAPCPFERPLTNQRWHNLTIKQNNFNGVKYINYAYIHQFIIILKGKIKTKIHRSPLDQSKELLFYKFGDKREKKIKQLSAFPNKQRVIQGIS